MTMNSTELARQIRVESLKVVARTKASHIGGALSMADLLGVLYSEVIQIKADDPTWDERDRFILSKGHSTVAVYAVLALKGFFPLEELETYGRDGSRLMAHVSHKVPGVEFSTGSLGHGLPFGCGKALAARRLREPWRTFVLLSDGELNEGSNWEAFLFAGHHRLDNLVAIIDYNRIQSLGRVEEVLELEPLAAKLSAFGWEVREVDGHDHETLRDVLTKVPFVAGKPSCLIARTTKGKGVDFMEDRLHWHYGSPDPEQLKQALAQLPQPE